MTVLSRLISALGGAKWAFITLLSGLVGILVGVALFTFVYANGVGYFGHESKTCVQCHAMKPQYDAWSRGSHANVATCQDCHNPHDNVAAWLVSEADNGFWHSLKFTFEAYPTNMRIRPHNLDIVESNCLKCHGALTSDLALTRNHTTQISCTQCHSNVGHRK